MNFEKDWQKRFIGFANEYNDDAGIAGWSPSGLAVRIRTFKSLWNPSENGTLWVDIGCGAGTYTNHLVQNGKIACGLDYNVAALMKGKKKYVSKNIHWCAGDAQKLPFKSASFDGVVCFGVTQALSHSTALINEIHRVLKPGGELWIDGLNSLCVPHLLERSVHRMTRKTLKMRYENPNALINSLKQSGFHNVKRYWVPIAPSKLKRLQPLLESRAMKVVWNTLHPAAALLSHAFMIKCQRE